jgi:copper homeostasis protein
MCDDAPVPNSILEVIAVTAVDARAAADGGADRIELVAAMRHQGLTPSVATFTAVRSAVDLPLRVMLRSAPGYAAGNTDELCAAAAALRTAGADEFVLGFLDEDGAVDLAAVKAVAGAIEGCRWTFHRALDHAADRSAARRDLAGLPGLDFVLTAGGPGGVAEGLQTLIAEAGAWPQVLAGGGLRESHLAGLLGAGVTAFHTGSAVRPGGSWDAPVDARLVEAWRAALP